MRTLSVLYSDGAAPKALSVALAGTGPIDPETVPDLTMRFEAGRGVRLTDGSDAPDGALLDVWAAFKGAQEVAAFTLFNPASPRRPRLRKTGADVLGGYPVIQMDGNDYTGTGLVGPLSMQPGATIFAVARAVASSSTWMSLFDGGEDSTMTFMLNTHGRGNFFGGGLQDTPGVKARVAFAFTDFSRWDVYTVTLGGEASSIASGAELVPFAADADMPSALTSLYLGSRGVCAWNGPGNTCQYFNGFVAEYVFVNRALPEVESAGVALFLRARYGL